MMFPKKEPFADYWIASTQVGDVLPLRGFFSFRAFNSPFGLVYLDDYSSVALKSYLESLTIFKRSGFNFDSVRRFIRRAGNGKSPFLMNIFLFFMFAVLIITPLSVSDDTCNS